MSHRPQAMSKSQKKRMKKKAAAARKKAAGALICEAHGTQQRLGVQATTTTARLPQPTAPMRRIALRDRRKPAMVPPPLSRPTPPRCLSANCFQAASFQRASGSRTTTSAWQHGCKQYSIHMEHSQRWRETAAETRERDRLQWDMINEVRQAAEVHRQVCGTACSVGWLFVVDMVVNASAPRLRFAATCAPLPSPACCSLTCVRSSRTVCGV